MNRMQALADLGQSIWLDYIRRDLILSGGLDRLVREDGLKGVTSNPAIFEKAIAGSPHYATALRGLLDQGDLDAQGIYEALAVRDIQDAADVLRPVFDGTQGADGFVSLEVSPYLARDTEGTLKEARRLKRLAARPNVFIKIPATPEGIPAIRQATAEGVSVNITLLFAQEAYEKVAEAYIDGLEAFAATGGDLSRVASVASFFISRIDTLADGLIQKRIQAGAAGAERARLEGLLGQVAIANGRQTYQKYQAIFSTPRFKALAAKGARTQRVLWASTSTKNPAYRDVLYVEELIGKDTVNTLPPQTMEAFKDHGRARSSLEEGLEEAALTLQALEAAGIPMREVTDRVLEEGVRLFADAFDTLLGAVERKRREILGPALARQTVHLPADLQAPVQASLEAWRAAGNVRRLWARDAALWTGKDEARWLDWLESPGLELRDTATLQSLARDAREGGFSHVLLLGMGGSSLGPEVLRTTFPRRDGFPELLVLDSTDPAQIRAFEDRIDIRRTLVIVSSKSGSTLEPNILLAHFLEKARKALGEAEAARRFVAITDPGSSLERDAASARFGRVFFGRSGIGGRFSVLSKFGLAPAAAAGIDVDRLLTRTLPIMRSCAASVPPADNPGVVLGTILGVLGSSGRDKVTIVTSPRLSGLGAWLEQLLAESTGKSGKGLIPVDGEKPAPPADLGRDRVVVYLRLDEAPDPGQDRAVDDLQASGQPVVRIGVPAADDLGGEFFRWEIATAVAGSILGLNPFDQPDVEAAKVAARALTDAYEKSGALPAEKPILEEAGLRLFADPKNARALEASMGRERSLAACLRAHLGRLQEGDYFALLAFVAMSAAHEEMLQAIRHRVRSARKVATCLGFGPRFLHSTGQVHKGGPASGLFLQVTCDEAADLPVPGRRSTFGIVKAAQARGDFQVLAERGRRLLRVHLGPDVRSGLAALGEAVTRALS